MKKLIYLFKMIVAVSAILLSSSAKLQAQGNALNFDGVNDGVYMGNTTRFDALTLTIEAWVKRDATNNDGLCLFSSRNSSSTRFSIHMGNNFIGLWNGLTWSALNYTFEAGRYYHIAVVMNPGVAMIYVNGSAIGVTNNGINLNVSNLPFQLGSSFNNNSTAEYFKGTMDEVRIWNTLRTSTEITANLNNIIANPASEPNLLSYYNFDQGNIEGNNSSISSLIDAKSSPLNGSLTNFALSGNSSNWVESYAMVVPTATAASAINGGGFTVNWSASVLGIANDYKVDVSTSNNFSTLVNGSPFTSTTNSLAISGLSPSTAYYYRVRSNKTSVSGQGANSNTITATTTALTPPGNALHFDGINDVVSVSTGTTFFDQGFTTAECWVKRDAMNGLNVCLLGSRSATACRYSIHMGNSSVGLYNGSSYSAVNTLSFEAGKWYHIAVVIKSAVADVYVNGDYVGSTTNGMGTATNLSFQLGAATPTGNFEQLNGCLDEVRIFNYQRTAAEINNGYRNIFTNLGFSNLMYYAKFDQGVASGSGNPNTLTNSSPYNGLNGTLNNFALSGTTSNFVESYAMVIPTATAATNIKGKSFVANWSAPAVGTVDNYVLDISTDPNFATFLSGYNGLSVTGTSRTISGLSPFTQYYYRVRANKSTVADQSLYSNTVSVITTFLSSNVNLVNLTTNPDPSSPGFSPTTTGYYVTVLSTTPFITITATADSSQTITAKYSNDFVLNSNFAISSGLPVGVPLQSGINFITITVTAEDGFNRQLYTVVVTKLLQAPIITSISPTSGKAGDTITITGSNFPASLSNNIVYFGAVRAIITSKTQSTLKAIVPLGATYSPISVFDNTQGLTAMSMVNFNPIYSPAKTGITATDFNAKVDLNTQGTVNYSAIGDLDNDGKSDIVVVDNGANRISIFKNMSNAGTINSTSFSSRVDFGALYAPSSVAIADFDGDGKLDIVVVNNGNGSSYISVFKNVGSTGVINSSSFTRQDYSLNMPNSSTANVAIGDFDGDGRPDFVVSNIATNTVSVFRNTCSIGFIDLNSFASPVTFTTGSQPQPIAVADIDGDGKQDIITGNRGYRSSSVSVLRNNNTTVGTISFNTKQDFACGEGPYGLKLGDINGDGKIDIVTGNSTDKNIAVLINNSTTGSITSTSLLAPQSFAIGAGVQSVNVGDLDGDGKIDLVVTSFNSPKSMSILKNISTTGSVNFATKVDFTAGLYPWSSCIADLDNDGKPDIVTSNNNNYISIFRNAETATCIASASTFTVSACNSYTWAAKGNKVYTASNTTDTIVLKNASSCDSVVTLNLTINQPTSSTTNLSVCSSQLPYTWNGLIFNATGTQSKTFTSGNSKGCDSTATLVLAVVNNSVVSVSVSASANNVCAGTAVTFTATPTNGGTAPVYQWKKNNTNVGTNSATYTDVALLNNDSVWCVLTSNSACINGGSTATSNKVKMTIKALPSNFTIYQTNLLSCTIGATVNVTTNTWNTMWSSSDTNVATVTYPGTSGSNSGAVKSKVNGTTILYCTITGANGCSNTQSVVFKVDAVTPAVLTGASSGCVGSTIPLTANVVGGVWTSSSASQAPVSTSGVVSCNSASTPTISYKLTNSSNCNATTTKALTINAKPATPTINFAAGTNIPSLKSGANFCNNRNFTLVGSPAGGVWGTTNTAVVTVSPTGQVNTVGIGTGSVTYTVTNAANCSSASSIIGTVVACSPRGVSLTKDPMPNAFTIYPNPSTGVFNIKVEKFKAGDKIVITDILGKVVIEQNINSQIITLNSQLSKGMYLVSVVTEGGKETRKVIIE